MAVLTLDQISVSYRSHGGIVQAVDRLDLQLEAGRTLGLVGESGCGKSSLARALTGLSPISHGKITFAGETAPPKTRAARLARARRMQMVFQDPLGSLNPRMTIRELVEEPLHVHRLGVDRKSVV